MCAPPLRTVKFEKLGTGPQESDGHEGLQTALSSRAGGRWHKGRAPGRRKILRIICRKRDRLVDSAAAFCKGRRPDEFHLQKLIIYNLGFIQSKFLQFTLILLIKSLLCSKFP